MADREALRSLRARLSGIWRAPHPPLAQIMCILRGLVSDSRPRWCKSPSRSLLHRTVLVWRTPDLRKIKCGSAIPDKVPRHANGGSAPGFGGVTTRNGPSNR